jgi:CheY-like chemotaxis protein/class 3 adenylate cyclase/HAMP domain-containing protein
LGVRALLVQSDPSTAATLSSILEGRGDEVWNTDEVKEAYGLIDLINPDLLLLDLNFPGFQWLDLLKYVRQNCPSLKVVMTTKKPNIHREMWAQQNGAGIFLRQPFSRRWLERALSGPENPIPKDDIELPKRKVRFPIGNKFILPSLGLSLLLVITAFFIARHVLIVNASAQFQAKIFQTGDLFADWFVVQENMLVDCAYAISGQEGFVQAVAKGDDILLQNLLTQKMIQAQLDAVEVLDGQGISIVSFRRNSGDEVAVYDLSSGDKFFQKADFVRNILYDPQKMNSVSSSLEETAWGDYLYIAAPIVDNDSLVGILLIGRSLPLLGQQIQFSTNVNFTLYNNEGTPLWTNLVVNRNELKVLYPQAITVMEDEEGPHLARMIYLPRGKYIELLVPWKSQSHITLGVIGVAQLEQVPLTISPLILGVSIAIVVLVIALTLFLGTYFSRDIHRLLRKLDASFAQVSQGDLEVKLEYKRDDELDAIVGGFNRMVLGIQERLIEHDLLGSSSAFRPGILPLTTQPVKKVKLEAHELIVTVMSIDIVDLENLLKEYGPQSVYNWITALYNLLAQVTVQFQGRINQIEGTRLCTYFGVFPKPLTATESVYQACEAAQKIQEVLVDYNDQQADHENPPFVVRVIIHVGPGTMGVLNVLDRLNYSISGSVIDIERMIFDAARKDGIEGVVITSEAYDALGEYRKRYPLKAIQLKFKEDVEKDHLLYKFR